MIPLAEIEAARERLAGSVVRTPLVRLEIDTPAEIYLKLENLQPIGSFKLRGAGNALALASPEELERGVWTASAGNMAQGVAWWARRLGVTCTLRRPRRCAGDQAGRDHAPGVGDRPGLVRRVVGGLSDAGSRRARRPLRAPRSATKR